MRSMVGIGVMYWFSRKIDEYFVYRYIEQQPNLSNICCIVGEKKDIEKPDYLFEQNLQQLELNVKALQESITKLIQ